MFKILLASLFLFTQVTIAGTQSIVRADLVDGVQTEKNYLKDGGHFEKNANGWVGYDDAAASPVDCTGGSFDSTFSRQSSSAMSGDGYVRLDKSAANRQGEGAAYAFSIDNADKGKVLKIQFDYLTSANFVDNDVRIFIYDVTNSRLIEPSPNYVKGALVLSQIQPLEFQTSSDSTSYKLCVHIAGTTATAWTLDLDSIKLGRSAVSVGAYIGPWTTYTPTGAWNTNVSYAGKYRIIGDTGEGTVQVSLTGAPNAANFTLNLPFTIDITKLNNNSSIQKLADVIVYDDAGGSLQSRIMGFCSYNTTTSINCYSMDDASGSSHYIDNISATTPITFANNDKVEVAFKSIPILGKSTNQALSSDSGTSSMILELTKSSNQSFSAATDTKVTFDGSNISRGLSFDDANDRITINEAGDYFVFGSIGFSNTNTEQEQQIYLRLNGSNISSSVMTKPSNVTNGYMSIYSNFVKTLKAGDYIELWGKSTSGIFFQGSGSYAGTKLSAFRISGNQQIAATEFVGARYQTDTARSFADATTTYPDFEDKVFDSHNAVAGVGSGNVTTTGTGWRYVVPIAGKYRATAGYQMTSGGGWAAGERFILVLRKNNTGFAGADQWQPAAHTTFVSNSIPPATIDCVAGDIIEVTVQQSSGAALNGNTNAAMNYIEIVRVGL